MYDVVVLGAGASGLMCASELQSLKVAIIDHNQALARKVQISGGGKCNVTNVNVDFYHYDGDDILLEYIFSIFSKDDLLDFLEENGIDLEIRKSRYYFCKNSANEIIKLFQEKITHCDIYLQHKIQKVEKKDDVFYIYTPQNILQAKKVVVATGGKSFEHIGATDIGLKIANDFGIAYKQFTPALVGLSVQKEQFWMKELSGLSCFVKISVGSRVLEEDMLFTHKGLSGPVILSTSLYWKNGTISIDFLPNHSIENLVLSSKEKLLSSVIPLAKRLSKMLLQVLEIEDKKCKELTPLEIKSLQNIHNYTFAPAGNFGFKKAEVSRGGIATEVLNPYTLESLDISGLHFIGEVVDVTGELGGYNFQWAFSSGFACAMSLK